MTVFPYIDKEWVHFLLLKKGSVVEQDRPLEITGVQNMGFSGGQRFPARGRLLYPDIRDKDTRLDLVLLLSHSVNYRAVEARLGWDFLEGCCSTASSPLGGSGYARLMLRFRPMPHK